MRAKIVLAVGLALMASACDKKAEGQTVAIVNGEEITAAELNAELASANVRQRGGTEALALQSRISKVITAVAPETLERLIRMERNEVQRQRFLLEITQSMAVDAVLDLVQAAATATSRSISPALLQLLGKLAEHGEVGAVEETQVGSGIFNGLTSSLLPVR